MANHDDIIRQMQQDELLDASKLTPREYARLRGMSPQLVYYHIRNHDELELENCICGRKVLDVKLADEYFNFNQDKELGDADG